MLQPNEQELISRFFLSSLVYWPITIEVSFQLQL